MMARGLAVCLNGLDWQGNLREANGRPVPGLKERVGWGHWPAPGAAPTSHFPLLGPPVALAKHVGRTLARVGHPFAQLAGALVRLLESKWSCDSPSTASAGTSTRTPVLKMASATCPPPRWLSPRLCRLHSMRSLLLRQLARRVPSNYDVHSMCAPLAEYLVLLCSPRNQSGAF